MGSSPVPHTPVHGLPMAPVPTGRTLGSSHAPHSPCRPLPRPRGERRASALCPPASARPASPRPRGQLEGQDRASSSLLPSMWFTPAQGPSYGPPHLIRLDTHRHPKFSGEGLASVQSPTPRLSLAKLGLRDCLGTKL